MGAGDEILKRLDALDGKVDRLIKILLERSPSQSSNSQSSGGIDPLPDHQLDNSWADKEIKRDPSRYDGPSMVGFRYSEAPSAWHDANASFFAWKAQKGREENPVRLKNNGKPWWESDAFEARISAAWSRRNAGKQAPVAKPAEDDGFGGGPAAPFDPDALPF